MIRVAAVGDLHIGTDSRWLWSPHLTHLERDADVLLLAGDLTKCGSREEAEVLADELRAVTVPMVAVLGNHDYHVGEERAVTAILREAGVCVLEGTHITVDVGRERVGIAGTKGFGGGFAGACGSEFGEPEMKAFIRHTQRMADQLESNLRALATGTRIALLHYSPVPATLQGERLEIYPFLGSYLLAEAIDRAGADLVVHGHAHAGSERGLTPAGIRVRNVAQPVIKRAYTVFCFGTGDSVERTAETARAGDGRSAQR
jgi:Icc-related predicted phosphoesterase